MAINERLIDTKVEAAAPVGNEAEQGLILHLDANDVDSYDGDGSVWYDIKDHEYTPATNVDEHFNTVLYTGNGSTNAITGVGFQPDLVWIKNRDDSAASHALVDSVRGVSSSGTGYLRSDTNDDESVSTNMPSSLDSDGFTAEGNQVFTNENGNDYVAWCFKAGGAAVSNTDGDINSQVSVNNDLGFSIVSYTGNSSYGQTVGHGMDVAPELIFFKKTDTIRDWRTYVKDIGANNYMNLNESSAAASFGSFSDTHPTSTVFTTSDSTPDTATNSNGGEYIAYCFASKRGVSKVGSYTGKTGSVKVYTGFEPAFVLIKKTNTATNGNWSIFDNARVNGTVKGHLYPDVAAAEENRDGLISFNGDGFTLENNTVGQVNTNNDSYIYYAVAKNTKVADLTPSTDGEEIEVDLAIDPSKVYYSDSNYAIEQDGTVWRGNADNSSGSHEGEAYINNYFESGDTGKYYFEVESLGHTHGLIGFTDPTKYTAGDGLSGGLSITSWRNNYFYGVSNANLLTYNGSTASSSLSTGINTAGTVLAVAVDVATRNMWMGTVSSGTITWFGSGNPSTGANPLATLPSTWNFYQPLVADGSYSGSSARTGWHKLLREETASSLPTGFTYMKGAIKNADLELHLDAGDDTTVSASTWSDKANSNNGTLTNFSSTLDDFYDEELGNWITFDGSDDVVTIPHSSGIDIGSSGFSAEVWVYNEKTSGTSSIISNLHSSLTGYTLRINNGTDVQFFIYNSSTQTFTGTASSSVSANTWNHLLFTVASNSSGAEVKLYINGELSSVSGTNSAAYGGSGNTIELGRYPFSHGTRFLDGKLGQVRIYSSALTQDQIRQNYNFTKNNYPNGNDGTITGATWNPSGYFDFDGINDYIDLSNNTSFPTTTSQTNNVKAISAWIKPDTTSSNVYIFSVSSTTETKDYFSFDWIQSTWTGVPDLRLRVQNGGSGNRLDALVGVTATDEWVHVVAQLTTEVELYINGVKQTVTYTKTGSATDSWWISNISYATAVDYLIGQYRSTTSGSNASNSDGRMSKLKVYNKDLTQEEITALYNEGE